MLFFFFKQKTAYEMRISDWSSDVCSSDLFCGHARPAQSRASAPRHRARGRACRSFPAATTETSRDAGPTLPDRGWRARPRHSAPPPQIDRMSVAKGKSVSVRVDHGGRRYIKKKNKTKTDKKIETNI